MIPIPLGRRGERIELVARAYREGIARSHSGAHYVRSRGTANGFGSCPWVTSAGPVWRGSRATTGLSLIEKRPNRLIQRLAGRAWNRSQHRLSDHVGN